MGSISLRKSQRVACDAPALLDHGGKRFRGICANLSETGLYFAGAVVPVGDRVVVSVGLPHGAATVEAIVRHQRHERGREGVGIAFTIIPHDAQALVTHFLRSAPASDAR
jgi:hypothetical protein